MPIPNRPLTAAEIRDAASEVYAAMIAVADAIDASDGACAALSSSIQTLSAALAALIATFNALCGMMTTHTISAGTP